MLPNLVLDFTLPLAGASDVSAAGEGIRLNPLRSLKRSTLPGENGILSGTSIVLLTDL